MLRTLDSQNLYPNFNSSHFLPKTYIFDIHQKKYTDEEDELFNLDDNGKIWIAKNPNGCCGRGIKLVSSLSSFRAEI